MPTRRHFARERCRSRKPIAERPGNGSFHRADILSRYQEYRLAVRRGRMRAWRYRERALTVGHPTRSVPHPRRQRSTTCRWRGASGLLVSTGSRGAPTSLVEPENEAASLHHFWAIPNRRVSQATRRVGSKYSPTACGEARFQVHTGCPLRPSSIFHPSFFPAWQLFRRLRAANMPSCTGCHRPVRRRALGFGSETRLQNSGTV